MRLLIVEDDRMLGELMARAMTSAGYQVDLATSAEEGLEVALTLAYDAVVVDLGLPAVDGMEFIRRVRQRKDATPILIVTAQDGPDRKIEGLSIGADDYVVKPFDLGELLARLRVHIRRREGRNTDTVEIGDLSIDLAARQVMRGEAAVQLTLKEFTVLSGLVRRRGRFVSKSDLEGELYDDAASIESNTVEVAIYALRRKLGSNVILTARGLGYMIAGGG